MDLLELLIAMVWRCLCVPIYKNPLFTQVFFDEDILWEICSQARLSFCPGLLDVVQAASPPRLSFFKKLPTAIIGRWGIYALVLEKAGHTTLVYIGSASDAVKGIPSRWALYDLCNLSRPNVVQKTCPSNIKKALNDGYKIVHKGLLAWAPIPAAKDVPRFRLLFYAFEAMFSYLFWAMHKKTKDFEIRSCCPWSVDSFTYDGACSHNPLKDLIKGNFGFSAQQLEMLAKQSIENGKTSQQRYKARRKAADPEGVKKESADYYAHWKATDPEGLKKYSSDKYQRTKKETPELLKKWSADNRARIVADPVRHAKVKAKDRKSYKTRRASSLKAKVFWCEICQRACAKKSEFGRHNASKRHLKLVAEKDAGIVRKFNCENCHYASDTWRNFREHRKTHDLPGDQVTNSVEEQNLTKDPDMVEDSM